jgi:Putative zinc-finger
MTHMEAAKSGAIDRYLLGELRDDERESFEEHFFDCTECLEQVRLGVLFQANARAVLREEAALVPIPAHPRRRPWFTWRLVPALSMAACGVLVAIVGYQNLVQIPHLERPLAAGAMVRAIPGAVVSSVRAAADHRFSRRSPEIALSVPHEWEEFYSSYTYEIERRPGSAVVSGGKVENGAGDFTILVKTAPLQPGNYMLNVYGMGADGQRTAVARFPLTLTD